jgi:transketolase
MSSRKELANAIRALSMDAVQKAKSGHPGPLWVWLISPKFCGAIS